MDDQDHTPLPEPMAAAPAAPMSAEDRLRAFEDEYKLPRHMGSIERGVGSLFQANIEGGWGEKHRAHHAALESLVAAENEHQAASNAADLTHAKVEAADARAAETGKDL